MNPVRKMEAFLAKDPNLKDTAQRAFVSYAKAIFLMKDKEVFDVQALDTDSFAHSLGLAIPPRIRFLQRLNARTSGKTSKPAIPASSNKKTYFNTESDEEETDSKAEISDFQKNESEDSGVSNDEDYSVNNKSSVPFQIPDEDDSDDDILQVKRKDHDIELPNDEEMELLSRGRNVKKKAVTKAAVAKKLLKKKIVPNKKIVFDEEGDVIISGTKEKKSELAQQYENENEGGIDIEKAKLVLKEEDKFDKQLFKEKVKAKHKETKRKLKEQKKQEQEAEKDDFGDDESEEEPDLSWLPDPDKIYGQKDDDEMPEFYKPSDDDNEDVGSDEIVPEPVKEKKK